MPSTRPVPAQLPQSCLYVSLCASRARSLSVSRSLSPLQCSVLHHNGSERKFPGGFSESARGPLFVSVCRSSLLPRPPSSAPLPVCLSVCLPACLPLRARVCVCAAQASEVTWWPVMARWRRRSQRCICQHCGDKDTRKYLDLKYRKNADFPNGSRRVGRTHPCWHARGGWLAPSWRR